MAAIKKCGEVIFGMSNMGKKKWKNLI